MTWFLVTVRRSDSPRRHEEHEDKSKRLEEIAKVARIQ
jgi:hypothetical protein